MLLPDTSDVAELLQARTQPSIGGGDDTGDFSAYTTPTAALVTSMIAKAGRAVYAVLGSWDDLTDADLQTAILDLVTVRAAAGVEFSLQPASASADQSTYKTLMETYAADLKRLTDAKRETAGGGSIAGVGMLPRASGLDADTTIYPVTPGEPYPWPWYPAASADRW